MKINYTPWINFNNAAGSSKSLLNINNNFNTGTDALSISEIGKRLRYSGTEGASRLAGGKASDPVTSLMETSVSSMEAIIKKMHALAVEAKSERLSELDRMDMQIEMEDLRTELRKESVKMNKELAERSGYKEPGLPEPETATGGVLARAGARIEKGEAWDVAEGTRVFRDTREHYALSDKRRVVSAGDGNSSIVRTVREKLENADTIILMDAKSAKKGVQRLESELEKFEAMKAEFIAFKSDPQKNRDAAPAELLSMKASYSAMKAALQAKNEEAGKNGKPIDQTQILLTEIGIMKTDEYGLNPKLVYTVNPKGAMFAKLGRFFESAADSLSGRIIDESEHVTDVVDTNAAGDTEAA